MHRKISSQMDKGKYGLRAGSSGEEAWAVQHPHAGIECVSVCQLTRICKAMCAMLISY